MSRRHVRVRISAGAARRASWRRARRHARTTAADDSSGALDEERREGASRASRRARPPVSRGPLRRPGTAADGGPGTRTRAAGSPRKPQGQGFMAATSMMRAGYVTVVSARLMVICHLRAAGEAFEGLSGTRGTRRGRGPPGGQADFAGPGVLPPPTRPAAEMLWCGARNGRRATSGTPAGNMPATL